MKTMTSHMSLEKEKENSQRDRVFTNFFSGGGETDAKTEINQL